MRLLLVDDDPVFLSLLSETMAFAGLKSITCAGSAQEAAEIICAAQLPFDCFCLDIQMPEVTGIELCKWIRENPCYRSAPILMITAMSEKTHLAQALAAGADDYIAKPLDPLEVITRIRLAERMSSLVRGNSRPTFAEPARALRYSRFSPAQ